jgi:hypothetical protein
MLAFIYIFFSKTGVERNSTHFKKSKKLPWVVSGYVKGNVMGLDIFGMRILLYVIASGFWLIFPGTCNMILNIFIWGEGFFFWGWRV